MPIIIREQGGAIGLTRNWHRLAAIALILLILMNTARDNFNINFHTALIMAFRTRGLEVKSVGDLDDEVVRRILDEYGAMFVAADNIVPPPRCFFGSSAEVIEFQTRAGIAAAEINGVTIELQPAALRALLAARDEAAGAGLNITPRGGSEAARRGYDDTVRLWNSRLFPALDYWQERGELLPEKADQIRQMQLTEQIAAVLELEGRGVFFSKDFQKSILYSVAAPGASQHLAMLAFDTAEFNDPRVRRILARHGWYRTVKSDLPHFTFIGLPESELTKRGLRQITTSDGDFWIPNIEPAGAEFARDLDNHGK